MKFILLLSLLISTPCFADTVSLSDKQFKNIEKINSSLRQKYPSYKGMSGTKDKMEISGISSGKFNDVISKIDFDQEDMDKIQAIDEEAMIQKRMRKLAIDSLESEGTLVKRIKE